MTHLFEQLYLFFTRHRFLGGVLLVLAVLGSLLALRRISFSEDIAAFLPANNENRQIQYAYEHIGGSNKIVINVGGASKEVLMDAVDHLVDLVQSAPEAAYLERVTYTVDGAQIVDIASFVAQNWAYYLDPREYAQLDTLLAVEALPGLLRGAKERLLSPLGMVMGGAMRCDPLWISAPLLKELEGFKLSDQFETYSDYIFDTQTGCAVITLDACIPASDTRRNEQLAKALEEAIAQTQEVFEGVWAEPFGAAYIALTNARCLKRDSVLSLLFALVLIAVLLWGYFRSLRSVLLILCAIAFGGLTALALTSLMSPHLSLIAVAAGSIIVGIAVNYPLHFLSHMQEGYGARLSLRHIVSPLTTGNITTVAAFLSLLFLSSPALHDLGLFAAFLLVGTILFVLLVLPHWAHTGKPFRSLRFDFLAHSRWERNGWVMGAVAVLTLFFGCFAKGVTFNANMQSINYLTPVQREQMTHLLAQTQGASHLLYYIAQGPTLDSALRVYEQTAPLRDTLVAKGIGRFVPSKAQQRAHLEAWEAYWAPRRDTFATALRQAALEEGFAPGAMEPFLQQIYKTYEPQEVSYFAPITDPLAGAYLYQGQDGEPALVYTFLQVDPAQSRAIEERLNAAGPQGAAFAFDLSSLTRNMVQALSNDFDWVLYLCGFVVFVFLLLSLGSLELGLITFLPMVVAWIWILGLMHLLGFEFNIINIILATFIFGMGDDYTIFMTEGLMYEYTYGKKMLYTYKSTVALSALLMLIGIGVLIIARHPALRSLAQVTIIGMLCVVVMAYLIPPFFFHWLTTHKGQKRAYPLTLGNILATVYSFAGFLIGTLYLTLCGFFSYRRHGDWFHRRLYRTCRFVLRHIPGTTLDFQVDATCLQKPHLIIANHRSHLDLMAILSLTPKVVVITNNWAWNSPFYGALIRYAQFMPAEQLAQPEGVARVQQLVAQGYSVMIFPEGSRSTTDKLQRFHKGAFLLAQQLELPVWPVLLHGFGHVLPKETLWLRKGALTVRSLEPIAAEDPAYGSGYVARTKAISSYFKEQYAQLRLQKETPAYFLPLVKRNYIYKGREVARAARYVLREVETLTHKIEALPREGHVEIVDHGQGEWSLLAALVRPQLQITSVMDTPLQKDMALQCVSKPSNLNFVVYESQNR